MENRHTVPNGEKIRELRDSAGMTQEKLAAMSDVNRRTIQRAERGEALQVESLASIAAALNVPLPQILGSPTPDVEDEDLAAQSLVVLRRIQSGMTLTNTISRSFDGKITCEADPNLENIEVLTAFTSGVEQMMPEPWRPPSDDPPLTLTARLRQAVAFSEQIKELEAFGISIYTAAYTAKAQIPRYDIDEGHMYVTGRTPYELVTICRILIAPAARGERVSLKVDDLYVPEKAAPAFEGTVPAFESLEDIPF